MRRVLKMIAAAAMVTTSVGLLSAGSAAAQSIMQQCGQQYQAAKAANTLNGQTWNQFRTECAARLKAEPAATSAAAPAAPEPVANPLKPAPAATPSAPVTPPAAAPSTAGAATKPASPGRVAFVSRERQCGAEWKANKVALKAQTPGITWPKYLSQCNARLKAAGQ